MHSVRRLFHPEPAPHGLSLPDAPSSALLMSLLASESALDCQHYQSLGPRELQSLRKEQKLLLSRLNAATKRLKLETKMRDASISFSRANRRTSYTNSSENPNVRVESAQGDLLQLSARHRDIERRLLEHHASVLSSAVNDLHHPPDWDTESGSNVSSTSTPKSSSTATRFGAAHFYANHKNAASRKGLRTIQRQLDDASLALEAARRKERCAVQDMRHTELEKEERVTTLSLELQKAEESISKLTVQARLVADLQRQVAQLVEERAEHSRDVDAASTGLETAQQRIRELEGQLNAQAERETQAMDRRRSDDLRTQLERSLSAERQKWSDEKQQMEFTHRQQLSHHADDLLKHKQDSDELLSTLRSIANTHGLSGNVETLSTGEIVQTIQSHLYDTSRKLQSTRDRLDPQPTRETKDEMAALKQENENLRREMRSIDHKNRVDNLVRPPRSNGSSLRTLERSQSADDESVIFHLKSLWSVLPSPEARARKMASRSPTKSSSSPVSGTGGFSGGLSLSELDVRSLRSLYERKPGLPDTPIEEFTIEAFAQRVQALVADDRALIERLIRFAQSHDLLKSNADRAQRLARESSQALETYQKQVKMLQERHDDADRGLSSTQSQLRDVTEALEKTRAEKIKLQSQLSQQASQLNDLTKANSSLSANGLHTLADPQLTKAMEAQLGEMRQALQKAQEEIELMQSSELTQQTQKAALLDELNSMQTENAKLRDQLRVEQRRNGK